MGFVPSGWHRTVAGACRLRCSTRQGHRYPRGLSAVLASILLLAGCTRPYFMTQQDYIYYNRVSADYDKQETYERDIELLTAVKPRTIVDPFNGEQWKLGLSEAKRLALENNKQIALLRYSPAQRATEIEARLAAFDAFFEIGGGWERQDRQISSRLQTFGTNQTTFVQDSFGTPVGAGAFGFNATSGAGSDGGVIPPALGGPHMISLGKRNATGGEAVVGYAFDYQKSEPATQFTAVNPFYRSLVSLNLQQPLLQGAGVEFNRAPILIARASHEQEIRTFEQNVQTLLRDVELAYWQLYFSYQDLYSREVGYKQGLNAYQREKNKFNEGTGSRPDVAQSEEQLQFFRAARFQSVQRVLATERDLRELMGLPPDDGKQIVPADNPANAEYVPNWEVGVREALERRPELAARRLAIRAAEIELFRQQNGLLPDLTFNSNYTITGLDDEFDSSIDRLTDNQFADWYLGIRSRWQIGERSANAGVRGAELGLARARADLLNQEHTILGDLTEAYRNIVLNYQLIETQRERRLAAADELASREEQYREGQQQALDVLLDAQTKFADALRDEGQAVAQYNQSIVQWEFAKGTLLQTDNVMVMEELLSVENPKLAADRWKQWQHSIPIPIHKGSGVKVEHPVPNDGLEPLYPPESWQSIGVVTPIQAPSAAPPPADTPDAPRRLPEIPGSDAKPVLPNP